MQMRTLGTDLNVSAVGLGCMGFSHAYGAPTEEAEAVRLIRRAFDLGYTFFDTAEVYGTADDPHVNETLVGKALADVKNHTVIATKFGLRFDQESGKVPLPLVADSRPETIRKSVEGSLKRLGTDHIDLYFQHRIDPNVEPETVAEVMADLIREGKITHWGISEANEDYLRRAHAVCPVTAVQNRYSMMARHYEPLFPILEELDVGLVAFSPMANGFLTGQYDKGQRFDAATDYRAAMPQFTDKAVDQNAALLKLLADMAAEKGATSAQISMAWMLCKHPWIVPIPGTRKEDRMKEKVRLLSGGQRQALTLFMAVIAKPKLLLLDEHTAALDPSAARKVLEQTDYFAKDEKLLHNDDHPQHESGSGTRKSDDPHAGRTDQDGYKRQRAGRNDR